MTPYEILMRFQTEQAETMRLMKAADHNYSPTDLNPYHLEGDVWTHTMMVFNYAATKNFPTEVLLAALLHDVGKAYTLKTREKPDGKTYVSFFGHDGVSYYRSLDILRESYADVLTEDQILTVVKLVANHSVLYSWQNSDTGPSKDEWVKEAFAGESDFLSLLSMLVESDACGRIALNPSDVSEYRKYRDFITYPAQGDKLSMRTLTLLVGPPCSGKSTWLDENVADEVVISSDNIIMEIGEFETYSENWGAVDFKQVEVIMMQRFNKAIKEGYSVVVDRTNMSKKSRRRFLACARKGYQTKAVVFATSHKDMLARSLLREKREGKHIPLHVFHNMELGLSYPLLNEVDLVNVV